MNFIGCQHSPDWQCWNCSQEPREPKVYQGEHRPQGGFARGLWAVTKFIFALALLVWAGALLYVVVGLD